MAVPLSVRIDESISTASGLYHRLVLVVGPARSGKTAALTSLANAKGWPRFNVNLRLAERLLDLTRKQRAVRVGALLDDIVKAETFNVVLLDNIEMLFEVELAQDPLRLLQGLSRNRTVVASWSGAYDGHSLSYAEPGHREHKKYVAPHAAIVSTGDTLPTGTAIGEQGR